MSGTNWLDLSATSNRHIRTYVQGFLDISGGNLIVRNNNLLVYGGDSSLNGRLLVSGDSSLNGNVIIGSTLYPTGGINLQNNLNMGGLINQSGTTVQGGVIYQPIVTSDVSAIINASNIYTSNMTLTGSNVFTIGNTTTTVSIGVNKNPVTISGPLYALYDTSINGRLFVTQDASFISKVFIAGDVSLNTRLYVAGDVSLNSRVFISSDLSLNGNLNVAKDVNITGNLKVKQYATNLTVYTVNYNNLTVAEDMSLNGRLYLTGDASMVGNVYMQGNVGVGKAPECALDVSGAIQSSVGTSSTTYKNFYGKVPPTTSATLMYAFSTYALPTVSPNSTNATSNTWTNSEITWTSSASSNLTFGPFHAFNTLYNTNECWHDDMTGYTAATGVANTAFQTTVYTTGSSGATSTYNGQWLQIQSSVGLSMKTFYFNARSNFNSRLPQVFYIVGSNTGTGTWTPIFKGDTASTTGASISATVSLTDLGSSGTISNFYGSTSLTYTTYGNLVYAFNNFTYFRLIVSEICGNDSACNIGEWGLTFSSSPTTAIQTGPSRALVYMDPSNINQLDVSGSLALINSSPTSIIVTPNTTAANSKPWLNNNITWDASASSAPTGAAGAFNMSYFSTSNNYPWESDSNTYNSSTGVYGGSKSTTVSGSTINGEWLQIQSSVPVVLKNYFLVSRGWTSSLVDRMPATYTIAGSNDGSTWFNLHDASFTASPVTNVSGTSSQLTSVYQVSTATTGSTNSQNSNNNITGYTNQTNSYTYFRFIAKSGLQGKFGITGEFTTTNFFWNPTFTPAASSVSLALDNVTPNQLNVGGAMNVGGSLGIAGGITPMYTTPSFGPGQVGYSIVNTLSSSSTSTTLFIMSTITITPGVWILSASIAPSAGTGCQAVITTRSDTTYPYVAISYLNTYYYPSLTGVATVSSTTAYNLVYQPYSASSTTYTGPFSAVRIA
jgi:predicted acyltransferase (DUF342 family)